MVVPAPMGYLAAVAIGLSLLASVVVLRRLDGPDGRWGQLRRSRLLLGIPWGTLLVVAGVLMVYLVVQDGWADLSDPVTIPFQAWSYAYPTGMVAAGFAHANLGHLVGNLTAALVLGSLAEFAFSHYPRQRGTASFDGWATNPYVRALVVFPLGVVAVGLFAATFALGPVIGFSGAVFALAGFALVRYPLSTVLGLFVIQGVRRVIDAIREPTVEAGITPAPPSPPWWADVAIQGHAIGLLAGVALGLYLFRRRDAIPAAWRIWLAVVLFAIAQGLWAVYWFVGTDRFLLLQALGIVLVIVLAVLVAAALTAQHRPLAGGLTSRQVAVTLLACALVLLSVPAVPVNLVMADPGGAPETTGVEVEDYRVIYDEDVVNHQVAVVDTDLVDFGEIRTSGVIVTSERRGIWSRPVSAQALAERGGATIPVGGVGWRTEVRVDRRGWDVAHNGTVYQVWLEAADQDVMSYASEERRADVRIANHTVSLFSDDATFHAAVDGPDGRVGTSPLPAHNETTTLGPLTLLHRDGALVAIHDETVVRVAQRQD